MFGPGSGIGLHPADHDGKHFPKIFKEHLSAVVRSNAFNSFIMSIIGVNAIVIGLETMESLKHDYEGLFEALDQTFLFIYTAEFVLKLYVERKNYWKSSYNIFDFSILMISFLQLLISFLQLQVGDNILGVLRLLRALRTLRTISFIEGLQVLVNALIDTIRNSVLNVVILLVLLMLFFGVVGYYIFGYEANGDKERWGDLSTAMLTLFTFVTADGWTSIQERLQQKYPGSQWFTIVFIFLGHFIFTNLFIGIIIMNIHESTEKFLQKQKNEKEVQLKMKKEYLYKRQHDDVKQMLEKQKSSQYKDFQEMTRDFYETLRHDDYVIMNDNSTNLLWLETYLESLVRGDLYTHRVIMCHRNLVLTLSEMVERQYTKQFGLSTDDGESYIPRNTQDQYTEYQIISAKKEETNAYPTPNYTRNADILKAKLRRRSQLDDVVNNHRRSILSTSSDASAEDPYCIPAIMVSTDDDHAPGISGYHGDLSGKQNVIEEDENEENEEH